MAMAHHAPYDNYTRALGITDHAVERLRQRLDKTSMANTTHRSDLDLGNMIDQATMDAFHRSDYENEMDNGVELRIARLVQLPTTEPLFALVKPNNATEMTRHKMPFVVVTLYTKLMVDKARSSGRWAWSKGETGSVIVRNPGKLDAKKTAQLVEKLSGFGSKLKTALDLAEMKGEPIVPVAAVNGNSPPTENTRRAPPTPPPAPPPRQPAKTTWQSQIAQPSKALPAPPVASATETRLVTYHHVVQEPGGYHFLGNRVQVEYQASELKQRLTELYNDKTIDHTTIKVWREVKATVKVTVNFDIEE